MIKSSSPFSHHANWTARTTGYPAALSTAASIILVCCCITGPIFSFSDTWPLVINTGTTVVTSLMVFLIRNTQNRESHVVQLKLDELIRAVSGAHNACSTLKGWKKPSSSASGCGTKNLRALHALHWGAGESIPTLRKYARTNWV